MNLNPSDLTKPSSERYLLQLFADDTATKLTQHALDTIRPKVLEMAKQVVAEMEPRLQAALGPMHDQLIMNFVVRNPK